MKVIHLWRSDSPRSGGGGVVGMSRLHLGLRKAGIDSQILCARKTSNSPDVQVLQPSFGVVKTEKLIKQITSRLGLNDIHRLSSFNINQHEAYKEADIIHFHGTHSGFINYLALPTLTKDKPAVFTLRNMWAMTGHCTYSYDCDRWQRGCGNCPYPDINVPIERDATRIEWRLKEWVYSRSKLNIVTLSTWLTEQAHQSRLINRYPIHQIPNGIDTTIYQPLDREQCRAELNIPFGKKVLMFAAVNLRNTRKGGNLLLEVLRGLPESLKAETVLLLFGRAGETVAQATGMEVINLGYINDERRKVTCYSAADLFLFPTKAEALGNVGLESLACGTPVVSFKVGGVPDYVRPGSTGYLAELENAEDFAQGIVQLIEDDSLRHYMSQECRKLILQEYALELCAQRHIDLYRRLLQ